MGKFKNVVADTKWASGSYSFDQKIDPDIVSAVWDIDLIVTGFQTGQPATGRYDANRGGVPSGLPHVDRWQNRWKRWYVWIHIADLNTTTRGR